VPDGVFVRGPADDGPPAFVALTPPTDAELEALLLRIARRVETLLARRVAEHEAADEPEPDALTWAQSEAVMTPAPHLARVLGATSAPSPKPQCAFLEGYSLHAGVTVHKNDRLGLERLCRYILRPPLASKRLARTDDGRVRYRFRRPDANGQTEILLSPEAFLARLATLIPPPRQNQLRYHGCFAPRSAHRAAIVPRAAADTRRSLSPASSDQASAHRPQTPSRTASQASAASPAPGPDIPATRLSRRLDWASLLQRVFALDVSQCAHCGGRVRILAFLSHPDIAHPILEHLGLPTSLPAPAPARGPPQLDLEILAGEPPNDRALPAASWR